MGYQESYVTINGKIEELITLINKLGKEHFEYVMAYPVSIITLQKDIEDELKQLKFSKGSKFIYFVGERSGQRNINAMFGKLKDELSNNISIIFTEHMPSNRIFTEPDFATHDEFVWK